MHHPQKSQQQKESLKKFKSPRITQYKYSQSTQLFSSSLKTNNKTQKPNNFERYTIKIVFPKSNLFSTLPIPKKSKNPERITKVYSKSKSKAFLHPSIPQNFEKLSIDRYSLDRSTDQILRDHSIRSRYLSSHACSNASRLTNSFVDRSRRNGASRVGEDSHENNPPLLFVERR